MTCLAWHERKRARKWSERETSERERFERRQYVGLRGNIKQSERERFLDLIGEVYVGLSGSERMHLRGNNLRGNDPGGEDIRGCERKRSERKRMSRNDMREKGSERRGCVDLSSDI
jgi:hypothetical protein